MDNTHYIMWSFQTEKIQQTLVLNFVIENKKWPRLKISDCKDKKKSIAVASRIEMIVH